MTTLGPSTATVASVAASTSSQVLFAATGRANGRTIFNDSTAILYVAFAATASTTAYTVQIAGGGYYELPQVDYSGVVSGVWSAANGSARLTSW